nr:hypothetical protein BaRGS_031915 [Batillaria attramentaria]
MCMSFFGKGGNPSVQRVTRTVAQAVNWGRKGDTELKFGNWAIYFSHIRMIEPGRLPSEDGITLDCGLHLYHINGCLFRLRPTNSFRPLKKGDRLTIPFRGQYYSVARSDILPNWYLAAAGLTSKVLACTAGESLDFVRPFDRPAKWKRFDYILGTNRKRRYDFYDPFTPEVRFAKNGAKDLRKACVVSVEDAPRYPYRGMHLDVSRNFHSKASVLRLLEVMSLYKMNAFHFHLTDDEGWRLQIPGLEELTEIGSKRSHDMYEKTSLLPLLGSGPSTESSGSGFFTVEDYREILKYAADRHIEVIPEIDMPGHCHAAVRAMQARHTRLKEAGDVRAAEQYLLSDLLATTSEKGSEAQSVQMFSENSLNPGLPSTFEFIRKVMRELQKMHEDISPLRVFHFGGDEVPYEAWEDSPACQALIDSGVVKAFKDLMQYFVVKVAEIAHELGLDVGAWQDGIVHKFEQPFPRDKFPNKKVAVYAWKNVWETGMAADVYKLANADYEVVLAPGTHLYFDHPQEPDPEERGLYWACRYTDLHKVFSFAPDNLFSNADVRLTGEVISPKDLKLILEDDDFVPLQKPENIVGVQGQLWTELVRTSPQLDSMIYPRLLALAERAWHEASWEGRERDDPQRQKERREDWTQFVNMLGYRELRRLDQLGVEYYLPPPGARVSEGDTLEVNCQIPGLPLQYSTDGGQQWTTYSGPVHIGDEKFITLRTCSTDGKRYSRQITMSIGEGSEENDS